jgi:hypothetical protein
VEESLAARVRPWLPYVAAYALALAVRAWFLGTPVYGDEAAHFYVSRHLGMSPHAPHVLYPETDATHWLFWQRPLFSLLLWPGAAVSFQGYRVWHALLSSLLAPLAMALVAQAGGDRWARAGVGVAVAVLPGIVGWGIRAFPDSLMAALFVAGVLLHGRGWHGRAAAAFLAAAWVKEVAAAGILAVFLSSLVQAMRRREVGVWPFRLDKACTAYLAAGFLAPVPLLVSVFALGGIPPGWSTSKATLGLLDGLFASAWLVPLVLLGLRWGRTRRLALWALVFPLFYGVYGVLLHRGVEGWYLVPPQVLALAAAAVALEEALRRVATPTGRRVGQAGAAALALLLLASAVLPGRVGADAVALPLRGGSLPLPDLHAALGYRHPLDAPVAALPLDGSTDVMVVDVEWFYLYYPFAETANFTGWSYTFIEVPPATWAKAVEGPQATLLGKNDRPMNQALRVAYADCRVWENDGFAIFQGQRCPGREAQLAAALAAASPKPAPRAP